MIRRILSLTVALVLLLTALPVSAEETAAQTGTLTDNASTEETQE
jgi:hypothetical protein